MTNALEESRDRLIALLERHAPVPGLHSTSWPGLLCFRADQPTSPDPTLYCAALCIVAQGAKEVVLGEHVYRYDPLHYVVVGADLPVLARVSEATHETPYLSLVLEIDTAQVHDLLFEMEESHSRSSSMSPSAPIQLSRLNHRFLDAAIRLLEATREPLDRRILAPAAMREVLYLALRSQQGDLLRRMVLRDGRSQGVTRALRYIHDHLEERFDVPTLAQEAGMSVSAFHLHFKRTTTLTPFQYLKRLRLLRARQLMIDEGRQAAEAALWVGYESPSQFSREFRRFFGLPPKQYAEQWTAESPPPSNRQSERAARAQSS